MNTEPGAQSPFQKSNFRNGGQNLRKSRSQSFLVLSNFTLFLYFVPNILSRMVELFTQTFANPAVTECIYISCKKWVTIGDILRQGNQTNVSIFCRYYSRKLTVQCLEITLRKPTNCRLCGSIRKFALFSLVSKTKLEV